jgi:hypothetical protein
MGSKLGYACAECSESGTDAVFMTYTGLNAHRRAVHPPASYASDDAAYAATRNQKRKNRELIDVITGMVERANREDVMWLEDVVNETVFTINRPVAPVAPIS